MRIGLACVFVSVLIGCSSSSPHVIIGGDDGGGSGDDDMPKIDAGVDADTSLRPPAQGAGFQIHSPEIDVTPGQDITFCYYLHLPNTDVAEIQSWESELTEGVQGVVLYTTTMDFKTPNTLSSDPCGYMKNSAGPIWTYQAQPAPDAATFPTRGQVMTFPADDGTQKPVGFPLQQAQPAYMQIHLVNPGTEVIHAQVKINGNTYPSGTMVTDAGPFITFSTKINIPAGSPGSPATFSVSRSCSLGTHVPANAKFFSMSTHTYRHGAHTAVSDTPAAGAATSLFNGTDWRKPNELSTIDPADPGTYHTFAGSVTFLCDYSNTDSAVIKTGDNAATDEICLSVGYFFPSPGGAGGFCTDGITL